MNEALSTARKAQAPLRVLIVEDESLVALDLEERLIKLGYAVCGVVDTGDEALKSVLKGKVDLILMDIHIRGETDGIETAAILRETADVPVVFLTAHADEATLERAGLTEPFGYVLKPFDERELRATIQMAHYRYRAEARLRKMERWLATTLSSIGDGVIATDTEGRVTFINAMAEAVSGWTRGAALGRHLSEVFAITTKVGPDETSGLLHRAMTDGVTITIGEGRFLRTRDGRLVPVDDSLAPIRDDHGEVAGCVVIFRDNTANLAAEQERRKLETKMQEMQRLESLGVMASGIAHDFNNLLVVVTCNASLGRTMIPADSPLVPCLKSIEDAATRAARLCHQMLDYAGKSQMMLQEVDLSEFTREAAQLLRVAMHKNTTLVLDLGQNLPKLRADRGLLQQVIMNLVINGNEAMKGAEGSLTVRTLTYHATQDYLSDCRVGTDLGEGEYLLLEVSDTGHGMTPEVVERIFDPFFTTKFTGRGLGLAAVNGIIRSHGGALTVNSVPGQGTTFQVLFPQFEAAASETAKTPDASWRGFGRALLVDDEETIRSVGETVLRHLGFEVDTAEDGSHAVEKLDADGNCYSVLLLDLTMPKLDGQAVLKNARARFPSLPVLLMSGYSDQQACQLVEQGGPVAFIQKPFTLSSLVAKLQPLLGS